MDFLREMKRRKTFGITAYKQSSRFPYYGCIVYSLFSYLFNFTPKKVMMGILFMLTNVNIMGGILFVLGDKSNIIAENHSLKT